MILGRKIEPPSPPAEPEWKPCADPRFEINAKGQKRTALPIPPAAPPVHFDVSAEFYRPF